ncbi:YkvA family protein [Candidatus Neomarinimicrobiota bacterium]
MSDNENSLGLTEEDKHHYQEQINNIELEQKEQIRREDLLEYQVTLLKDVTVLYTMLKTIPNLSDIIQKKILFALKYFMDPEDEIPDALPDIGLLDDAVVVHWIVDEIKEEYSHYFSA